MGLGPARDVSLAEAREKAGACRKVLLAGLDPIESRHSQRTQARIQAARGATFEECAEQYITAREDGWKNAVHRRQWRVEVGISAAPFRSDTEDPCGRWRAQLMSSAWFQPPISAASFSRTSSSTSGGAAAMKAARRSGHDRDRT
jgi:hypothetical protein